MTSTRIFHGCLALSLSFALALSGCRNCPTAVDEVHDKPWVDPALNGAWVDGVQSGELKVYITELRFNNGNFEWTWDAQLQQRGVCDTKDGILSVTIQYSYASPARLLGTLSRPYSIVADTLTWGQTRYTKK
jgi:hypothetical protein